jgi:predicted anti-sigma-YlaC factor YlaD
MNIPRDLTCQELVELVTDYLEGALHSADRVRFEEHLAGCAGCQAYLEQMRDTISMVGRVSEESLDPATRDQLLDLFRNRARGDLREWRAALRRLKRFSNENAGSYVAVQAAGAGARAGTKSRR